jgi:hypothetical protein
MAAVESSEHISACSSCTKTDALVYRNLTLRSASGPLTMVVQAFFCTRDAVSRTSPASELKVARLLLAFLEQTRFVQEHQRM